MEAVVVLSFASDIERDSHWVFICVKFALWIHHQVHIGPFYIRFIFNHWNVEFEGRSFKIRTSHAPVFPCSATYTNYSWLSLSRIPMDSLNTLRYPYLDISDLQTWCNVRNAFFTSEVHKNYTLWTCQKVCKALTFLLDNIYIRFGTKLLRQTVGIPMGTNCAPLVADLFLFCYERDFMMSFSVENQSKIFEAFTSTSRYLDDLLNIDNTYFDGLISRIYFS